MRSSARGSQIPVNLIFYFKQCNVYSFVQWLNFLLTMLCNNPFRMDNSVKYLQIINFSQLTLSEKTEIKVRVRPTPVLSIEQKSSSKGQAYTRHFNMGVYQKCEWICVKFAAPPFYFITSRHCTHTQTHTHTHTGVMGVY